MKNSLENLLIAADDSADNHYSAERLRDLIRDLDSSDRYAAACLANLISNTLRETEGSVREDSKLIAVDPNGCGCTECLVGEYIPLERATNQHLRDLISGKLRNHTDVNLDDYDNDDDKFDALYRGRNGQF